MSEVDASKYQFWKPVLIALLVLSLFLIGLIFLYHYSNSGDISIFILFIITAGLLFSYCWTVGLFAGSVKFTDDGIYMPKFLSSPELIPYLDMRSISFCASYSIALSGFRSSVSISDLSGEQITSGDQWLGPSGLKKVMKDATPILVNQCFKLKKKTEEKRRLEYVFERQ